MRCWCWCICLERGADCLILPLMPLHPQTPSSLASFKPRLVLPLWYWLIQVVLEKISLNWCSRSCSCFINFTKYCPFCIFLANGAVQGHWTGDKDQGLLKGRPRRRNQDRSKGERERRNYHMALGQLQDRLTFDCSVLLFCLLAVLYPMVGHTMDELSPFVSVLCHSDFLFHRESCSHLDVAHPGHAWSSLPACTWHCSLHYLFLLFWLHNFICC